VLSIWQSAIRMTLNPLIVAARYTGSMARARGSRVCGYSSGLGSMRIGSTVRTSGSVMTELHDLKSARSVQAGAVSVTRFDSSQTRVDTGCHLSELLGDSRILQVWIRGTLRVTTIARPTPACGGEPSACIPVSDGFNGMLSGAPAATRTWACQAEASRGVDRAGAMRRLDPRLGRPVVRFAHSGHNSTIQTL